MTSRFIAVIATFILSILHLVKLALNTPRSSLPAAVGVTLMKHPWTAQNFATIAHTITVMTISKPLDGPLAIAIAIGAFYWLSGWQTCLVSLHLCTSLEKQEDEQVSDIICLIYSLWQRTLSWKHRLGFLPFLHHCSIIDNNNERFCSYKQKCNLYLHKCVKPGLSIYYEYIKWNLTIESITLSLRASSIIQLNILALQHLIPQFTTGDQSPCRWEEGSAGE